MTEIILQRELKQYRELADESRRVTAGQEALRKSLIARIRSGAEVEPGHLGARLEESSTQRFSFDALVQILGLKQAEKIKVQLPVSVSHSLKIVDAA